MLAIPSNADRHLSTAAVLEENCATLGVRAEDASSGRLRSALQQFFSIGPYSAAAMRCSLIFREDQTTNRFRELSVDLRRATFTRSSLKIKEVLKQPLVLKE